MRLTNHIYRKELIVESIYLTEGLKHIEHFEDNVINNGTKGLEQDIKIIKSIVGKLSGDSESNAKLSTKWDGSPAVVFGYNTTGFFVSTKSAFNKTPKLAYTNQDIDIMFGSPDLKEKLKACLKYLPKIIDSGIYQGDLMFTIKDKKVQVINGERVISFTPNTITYTIPDDDSDLAKDVRKAKLGIIIHTEYIDGDFEKISFNVNKSMFKQNSNVWIQDAILTDVSGMTNFNPKEITDVEIKTIELESLANKLKPNVFSEMKKLGLDIFYKIFSNYLVRKGTTISNPHDAFVSFVKFTKDSLNQEINSIKTELHKQIKKSILDEILNFFKKFQKQLELIFNASIILTYIKNIIIQKLKQIKNIGTFISKGDEYVVTGPEGFCVVDNDGSVLKLVDRLGFSAANFELSKNRINR